MFRGGFKRKRGRGRGRGGAYFQKQRLPTIPMQQTVIMFDESDSSHHSS
jgi:hypothetical protein